MKRRAKTAAEFDVIGGWRRYYCYLRRPGVVSGIKRQMRRRERREARDTVRQDWGAGDR